MIDVSRRAIIIQPPKTGGQALQRALGLGRDLVTAHGVRRHDTIEQALSKVPNPMEWRRFILIRNPFARIVSIYHYHVQYPHRRETEARQYLQGFGNCRDFLHNADFDRLSTAQNPDFRQQLVDPCAMFGYIDGEYDESLVEIRTETLSTDAQRWFGLPGVDLFLTSDHEPWPTYFDDRAADRVIDYFGEDFERFGYSADWRAYL